MVAQAGGMQAQASSVRITRGGTGPGSAWTVCSRLRSEMYAIGFRAVADPVQPQPPSSTVVDAWAGGCTCVRNASLCEPAAYQARWHCSGIA